MEPHDEEPELKRGGPQPEGLDQELEKNLQAAADQADSLRQAVDALESAMKNRMQETPFDPEVQELKAQVEALRKVYPKID